MENLSPFIYGFCGYDLQRHQLRAMWHLQELCQSLDLETREQRKHLKPIGSTAPPLTVMAIVTPLVVPMYKTYDS